jgi:hypothetical protein
MTPMTSPTTTTTTTTMAAVELFGCRETARLWTVMLLVVLINPVLSGEYAYLFIDGMKTAN